MRLLNQQARHPSAPDLGGSQAVARNRPADWLVTIWRQRRNPWWVRLAIALLLVPAPPVLAADSDADVAPIEVHFTFSKALFSGVNENDAQAAIKTYTQTIGNQNGVVVNSKPELLDGTNAIITSLGLRKADLLALTADEFFTLEPQGLEGPLLLSRIHQSVTEEYVLLTRADNPIRQVEDLKGRSLNVSSDARATLSLVWLEVLCREHGLGPAAQVFTKITISAKATQVVLPVFFGKVDACIVTRNGWEVMCELNPQLKKQLKVIAVSPAVVPSLTCFRRGFTEAFKQKIIKAVELSAGKPGYKQLMALFKTDDLSNNPLTVLDGTRTLVASYHQWCDGTNGAKPHALAPGVSLNAAEGKGK